MGHGPRIWNYRFECATSWTNTCKVHKRGTKKNGMPGIFTNATRCPKMISPNSFCGFVFARAVDMNLDPPFLYNPLNKNVETNWNYYSEAVELYTRFWNEFPNSFCGLHKGHRYELRCAIPAKSSEQKWRNYLELLPGKGWILHKVLKWYLPNHSVDLSSQGP